MILVARPPKIPAALARGVSMRQEMEQLWDAHSIDYQSGTRKFLFKKSVYGHKNVKNALAKAQFEKCCYCEGQFRAHAAGDVEHYRPKGAIRCDSGKIYPGYYWLAYSSENLYFACPDCNAYRKRNQFPLEQEATRARSHHDLLASELPLLIDPGGPRDPRDHIRFYDDLPIGLTDAGRATIEILRLDREPLNERRRKLIGELKGDLDVIRLLNDDPHPDKRALANDARAALAGAVRPDAEFSSTASDYLAQWHPQN